MKFINTMKTIYYNLGMIDKNTTDKEISKRICNDLISGYLSINKGRDNEKYVWYYDGINNVCLNLRTREYITDSIVISDLFE